MIDQCTDGDCARPGMGNGDSSHPVDEEIIRLLQANRDKGTRLLLDKYGRRVKGYLVKRFGHVLRLEEIEDAFLMAAVKACTRSHTFDSSKGTLGGWFLGIARNEARAVLRKKGKTGSSFVQLDFDPPFPAEEDECLSEADEQIRLALEEAIEKLPSQQRAIIEADLAAGERADNERLAEELKTTVQSIQASRWKARQRLREIMKQDEFVAAILVQEGQ